MPQKVILKERDSKPIIDRLNSIAGYADLSHKSRVELQSVKDVDVIFVDGNPKALRKNDEFIPTLVNSEALSAIPKVVVDMGAVPHLVGGADLMAPGVRRVERDFSGGQLLVVVDEKHGKSLAVVRALQDSTAFSRTNKGKVAANLHHVGDSAWEIVKPFAKPSKVAS